MSTGDTTSDSGKYIESPRRPVIVRKIAKVGEITITYEVEFASGDGVTDLAIRSALDGIAMHENGARGPKNQ